MDERDDQIRNPDGTFTLAYLAYLVNTKRRKKRRKRNAISGSGSNMLAGIAWAAGTDTTLSIANGKARATVVGSAGATRIRKQVTGLTIGKTYRFTGYVYDGTATGASSFRVSTNADLTNGQLLSGSNPFIVEVNWVATATSVYAGLSAVVAVDGEYSEISEVLTMVPV